MNEILKKRIEEAADTEMSQYYNDDEYPCGIKDIQSDFKEAFKLGARFALSNQFISVEDDLPEYNKAVLIIDKTGMEGNGVYFNHRSNNPIVNTYENGFCDIGLSEVMYWCEVPKFETKK